MNTLSRLKVLQPQLAHLSRPFSSKSAAMAGLDISSRYRMLSGYEIPVLGYGVCNKISLCVHYVPGRNSMLFDYRPQIPSHNDVFEGCALILSTRSTKRKTYFGECARHTALKEYIDLQMQPRTSYSTLSEQAIGMWVSSYVVVAKPEKLMSDAGRLC